MKRTLICLFMALLTVSSFAYKLGRVSVHDPSVVWEPESKTYYIFGSHRAVAKTSDMMNWTLINNGHDKHVDGRIEKRGVPWATTTNSNAYSTDAFSSPSVTKVKKGGKEISLRAFDAKAWAARGSNNYDINGNLWAPDVIYNPHMDGGRGKWCMYMSINGEAWYSSIVLLTSDKIEGPYTYQAPVVISGFHSGNATAYKDTDLEIVIGSQSSLPSRYALKGTLTSGCWGERWPNCIDPCVFYDEQGKLWMSYGSWSGGIFMLELDEETGLRDYDVEYELKGSGNNITVDPYFGKKVAGGNYSSGEASYIEYIGGYYYLFVTYGGLEAAGGYQMRVFRSETPDGPYVDSKNSSAIFNSYQMNYGSNANDGNRGENIFGAYTNWGNQAKGNYGERSQGHNSIIAAEDGRTYLVYHTRFQDWGEGHQVRVHQVFQNAEGWLVAAPFEYTGEQVTSADIATTQQIATDQIPGKYKLLVHRYKLDHTKKQAVEPVDIELNSNGTISGDQTGTWEITEGTSYINLKISSVDYSGVMVEQTLEPGLQKAPAFTALANASGITAWGYKYKEGGDTPEQPVEATWKYEQDFSSQDGLTIVGGGSFVEDATFGHAYQNGGGTIRSHYLLLPEDVLSHSADTKQMTIAFWVNASNAGDLNTYTYAPLFTAYAAKANTNSFPMLALQSRGMIQINCNGYCDFNSDTHVDGNVNVYHKNAHEATEAGFKFVRNWLDDGKWHYYAITFKANEVVQYLDGEITNLWSLFSNVDGQQVTGLFSNGGDLKYVCLGGNQAWDWKDADAKFMFAKLLIQNNAMSQDDIKARMTADTTTGIMGVKAAEYGQDYLFDLQGRRVNKTSKGIYIQNGKKFVVR